RARPPARGGTGVRAYDDEDDAGPGMEHEQRTGDRGGGAGPGPLHADAGLPPRLRGLRRQAEADLRGRLMADKSFLAWPFFDARHGELARRLDDWAGANLGAIDHGSVDAACRALAAMLGRDGWLAWTAVDPTDPQSKLEWRSLCIMRETLARHDGLADFAFAMQGLGTGAISLFGTDEQKQWLSKTRTGKAISAFALSEPRSGSDVANMDMAATKDGDFY